MTDSNNAMSAHNDAAEKIASIQQSLVAYGQAHNLRGLEGRIKRGLDPAGMLAVPGTRSKLEGIANAIGADMKAVDQLTAELHVGAIWNKADSLAKCEDPNVQLWMIAAEATSEKGDLNEEEILLKTLIESILLCNKLLKIQK